MDSCASLTVLTYYHIRNVKLVCNFTCFSENTYYMHCIRWQNKSLFYFGKLRSNNKDKAKNKIHSLLINGIHLQLSPWSWYIIFLIHILFKYWYILMCYAVITLVTKIYKIFRILLTIVLQWDDILKSIIIIIYHDILSPLSKGRCRVILIKHAQLFNIHPWPKIIFNITTEYFSE